jgi:ribosomal protein S12 methylthiotransferase
VGQATSDLREAKGTYAFVSLGCPKNLIDSERMLGLLKLDGYRLVPDPDGADFVIVNTCGFVEQARQESFATIREMAELKANGKTRGLIVSGCLAERQRDELLSTCPDIDHLVGVFGREEITRVADRLIGHQNEQRTVFQPAPTRPLPDTNRLRITPRHFAYLKISEGCDRLCTFCAIPKMRGRHASKPMEEIVREARQLVDDGVHELIIVAQDTTYYGIDLYGEPRLVDLLRRLQAIDGLDWIRLMYFYPMYISDELIDVIASSDKILPYLDMPLQHINDTMLRRMARRVTRDETECLLNRLRRGIPNLALRTTFIVGFPGESEEQYDELSEFVACQRFEHMGVFTYSLEPDTPAAQLPGRVAWDQMLSRRNNLMEIQQRIVFERNQARVGRLLKVILDCPVPNEEEAWVGRSYADAPDVDGLVFVSGPQLRAGQIVNCEVVAAQNYDVIAAAV